MEEPKCEMDMCGGELGYVTYGDECFYKCKECGHEEW